MVKVRLTVSLPKPIMEKIVKKAKRESRSKSAMVLVLVKKGLKVVEKPGKGNMDASMPNTVD